MNFNLYLSALLIASACCSAVVVYLCWKRRELPIAVSYGLCILSTAFYTFGYASELVSASLETIRFWLRIEYIGIPFGTVFWFIMVLQYTGRQAYIRKWTVAVAMVIPFMTFIAHNTNEWHHLFYKSLTLDYSEGFPLARIVRGPLYYVHVVYAYVLILVGVVLLVRMYFKSAPSMKKHVVLMLIGSLAPYASTLVYLSEVLPTPFDISPFGFVLSNIFFLFGIYQFNLLRLAPMALQKVFESMQDAVVLLDLEHNITGFNQAAGRTIQGLGRKNGIGQPAATVFAANPELLRRIDLASASEDKELLMDEAADRYYSVQVSLIADFRSRPAGKMLLLRDVTDAVRSEERLRENARQLRELNAFKDQMFNVVAHDIRDPMAVLLNLTELLEEEASVCGEDHEEIVQEMSRQVHSTFALVESLLEWFRSQRGGMVFVPIVQSLSHSVQRNVRLLQGRSDGKGIRITSDIEPAACVFADKEMLDLVLRNLLSNAIKFTELGGDIRVRAWQTGGFYTVSVSDSGIGIPEDRLYTLLREDNVVSTGGTAGERGVGLGLALCKEFVRLNGGEFWFDSTPEQGSTFYFTVPAAQENAAPDRDPMAEREIG
ncbi:sensor histidine kinase [Cohnella hashimotonis]|uniref:histidine kinase n=1 Tax=Cohnella hashimotonis TaxID=2826895 RepID=A0ABT6TSV3_9BACL|nr:histidine kinase N-terminal 7TM domain-containing protein [Cohnella hashimotonis]MDI4649880.1 histidine kinase N-terminal 7TM domain-containing protein [Cohnella hashimotonis]